MNKFILKYKIYSLPEIVKRRNTYYIVLFRPIYDERHLTVYDNKVGLYPEQFKPKKIKTTTMFDVSTYKMSDYKRRKWQILSGNISHIYALIYNKNNKPFYIGSTIDCEKRLYQHRRNKKGTFRMVVLCDCPQEFQFDEERRWINGAKEAGFDLINLK